MKKDLKIIDSDFSSFSLGRSTSLLASTDIWKISVFNCHFSNISQSARIQNNQSSIGNSKNDYRFEGCFVEKVESPLGGGLVEGMRSEYNHFLALNSSYSQCVRRDNADPVIGNKTMKRQAISSGDATFVDCDFNNLSTENSSNTNGGAILFSSSGILNVTLCKFHSCHSSYCGGAISSRQSGKNFAVTSSKFDSCTAEASGGCIDFYYVSTVSMKSMNCSNSSTKHVGGGIFFDHNEYQGLVENCHFYCCRKNTTQYNGGGDVGFYRNGTAILSDCSFCGGYSEKNGAGVGWLEMTGISDSQIKFCFFSNNTAVNLGHDVYVAEGWTNINENSFVYCRSSTSASSNRVVKGETGYDNWVPKIFFNPVFVNSMEGLDHMACGFVRAGDEYGRRCKTIEFGMSVLDGDRSSNEVIIEFGDYEENKIDVGKMRIAFEGKDKAQVVVFNRSPNGESLVAIGTGEGSFRKITFVCGENPSSHLMEVLAEEGMLKLVECVITALNNEEGCVFTASLMIVQKGSVSFDSVEINGISFSSVPAFEIRGESSLSFQMNNVDAHGISRASGDGSVICGNLVNGMNVNISGGMMRNCECEDGCGGGMWIQLDECSKMEIGNVSSEGADDNVDCVTFSSCSCVGKGNGVGRYGGAIYLDVVDEGCAFCIHCARFENCQAEKGNNIFVNAKCLRDVVNHITFRFECEGMIDSDLLGFEDGCREECVPLLPFLMEAGDVGFVGGEKSLDFSRCGMEQYPCSSINKVVELWYGAVPRTIRIKNGFVLCEEVVMESQFWNVTGTIGDTAVEVVVPPAALFDSECVIRVSSEALLKDMCFSLPSALSPASSFILSSSNALSVSDCSIEPAIGNSLNEIEFCVFQIDGGVLHMTGFSNKGSLNTLSDPIIRCGGECSAVFSNCVLTGISRRNGGGSCLERICEESESESESGDASVAVVIVVSGCTFSECCVEEKDECGGGMKISINKDEEVVINGSTTFDGCKSENETDSNGRGGGVMISVGSGGSLKMKEVKFEGCEVPSGESDEVGRGMGGGMFVELPNELGTFILEGMIFEGCKAWKGNNVFVSGWNLREIVNKEHLKWEMSDEELRSLDELCGWERKTTGEGYVIPLVVYLWSNWSEIGYVSKEKGGDFSGCGYSEAPCSSINHLISLRYGTLGGSESHVIIVDLVLLQNSLRLIQTDSDTPKISIEGEENGTVLRIEEEKEIDGENGEAMVASEVILSFVNVSFSLPNVLVHYLAFLKSSSMNGALSVKSCSFVGGDASKVTDFCLVKVDEGSVVIEDCTLKEFHFSQGFVELSSDVKVADVMNLSITNTSISGRSLISLSESALSSASLLKEAKMLIGKKDGDGVILLSINSSSFTSITCNDSRATVLNGGSFDGGMKCCVEKCVMTKCQSEWSEEGGGMKVNLKSRVSELRVSGCSFGMCICSTVKGRGGGLMVDASGLDRVQADTGDALPLGIMIESTRFTMNDALVGKDVFIWCKWIEKQINEKLFSLDFSQDALKSNNSICGSDEEKTDIDLIPLITFYYGQQVFVKAIGRDIRQCGEQTNPCKSISCSVDHIQRGVANIVFIDEEGMIGGECEIGDLSVKSMKKSKATVHFNATIQEIGNEGSMIMFVNECVVEMCVLEFWGLYEANHRSIMKVKNGTTVMRECECLSSTTELVINNIVMAVEGGKLEMDKCAFTRMKLCVPLIEFVGESEATISETNIDCLELEGNMIEVEDRARVEMKEMDIQNITLSRGGSAVHMQNLAKNEVLSNCSFGKCLSSKEKGSIVSVSNCANVRFDLCRFSGDLEEEAREERGKNGKKEEICKWNGSVVDVQSSNVRMKDTTISNSKKGGLSLSGGSVVVEKGEFENNNPSVERYPSIRRNVICSDSGTLNVVNVKGGDGIEKNTSLWILDEGCQFGGIAAERASPFFIPILEDVKNATHPSGELDLIIHGKLLLPCDLSVKVSMKNGDEEEIVRKGIDEEGYVSENEIHSIISSSELEKVRDETEVSVWIVFGKVDSPSSTDSFILKNRSESKTSGDERIAEGGKKERSIWAIIVIVLVVILLIVLIVSIIVTIRWRKQKRRAEELEVIVEDNIKKDPKLIEMMTMEMSPEEQWRRAERDAEKKNEEKIKKRVYAKSLGHSESSEHLLSESGSTEYILGKDSDKIPEWILEKVDEKEEEEETRKRTPSPSISSTSTTSTTDSDSTFVRGEDLCPTTSSMSNLVDAMACSSPHEKLIVDLRDSLFMLLHGRNEKKEMVIGSLRQREQTAAQILFWVANLALHSFDEMNNPLSSLANLSPHVVLFSEHMVICIVMHSDLLSDDDSDSSSISSSTVVTSASDDDDSDSLPSSAFEDEDSFKKECLRWKAPELQINKKRGATKESVAFSIGMMLWECLTLEIPFGEYEAEVAGQKIVNGERPDTKKTEESSFGEIVKMCLVQPSAGRPCLGDLKREFIQHFPASAVVLTMSDALFTCNAESCDKKGSKVNNSNISKSKSRNRSSESDVNIGSV
ncbi:uncharacterized protein MONOS_6090 [Monocercomonoides exilis]|uniref:uncharacterized protein n=1 Tax=Monocercomonoides exilis TaxID=2049356 RepID=UPI003559892A|nr:hypothetical protein MONOS_6090 [Monocercomonoides exilis]|eukprot:MONOS_6090.1-p1 / transcript=MONOS_6090.1 / gene=MONOS_6090 / organism=Monocercomonoides_exilis_PA203 / gene_product=unspecified product / transcript_product=unspecified product / location=Mono_scaffold00187:67623-75137(-) / protein_length=2504 / sequence_SO=supercontig / SO=protein_coding / is_pseudo=false